MGLPIVSGIDSTLLTIDPTSFAARVLLYGSNGTPLVYADGAAVVPGTTQAALVGGHDGPAARMLRSSSIGNVRGGADTLLFADSSDGATININKWVQTTTTMTITQTAGAGTLFNANSTLLTTTGALQTSSARFPTIARGALVYRSRAKMSAHVPNNLIELGFFLPASATAVPIGDGACWRKDGAGQWVPVISTGGSETLGTPVSDATFRASVGLTDYATFEVLLEDSRATFRILTQAGVVVNEQTVPFGGPIGSFTATRIAVSERTYNVGATASAVQLTRIQTSVWYTDQVGPDYTQTPLWMANGSLTSPTAYTQLAQFANNAAPANATLSNTTPSYSTLGGLYRFQVPSASANDNALFGFQVPTPYGLTVTRVAIDAFNDGVAVATTATVLQWGIAFNSSAASLVTGAPTAPMRKAIGSHSWDVGAPVGKSGGNQVIWQGKEKVQPGRFFHVIVRQPIGSNTVGQFAYGSVCVDGFFE